MDLVHSCVPGSLDFLMDRLDPGPAVTWRNWPGGLIPGWSGPAGVARPLLVASYLVQALALPGGEAARPFTFTFVKVEAGAAALLLPHASCMMEASR